MSNPLAFPMYAINSADNTAFWQAVKTQLAAQGLNVGHLQLMGAREHGAFNIHKQIDKTSPYFANALCQSKRLKKAVIHYYDVNDAGFEFEVYRVTLDSIVIMSVDAAHTWVPGSRGHNMLESIGIRYHGIEWFYLDGCGG
jgi:type VI secretion system secreted protein Hcp